jgi:hypothetical protein
MERDALVAEILELATACQTGSATEDERARLERLLEDNPEARDVYLRVADDTVTLNDVRQSRSATPALAEPANGEPLPALVGAAGIARRWRAAGFALAAGLAALAAWNWPRHPAAITPEQAAVAGRPFARVVSLSGVEWGANAQAFREWDHVGKGQTLEIAAGSIEVLYENGVQFIMQGPAKCQFLSESQVLASSGKLVARVGPEATGFEIMTPHAKVIDRGTSFGMTIDPDHQTDVVVYEGIVDLSLPETSASSSRRLEAGEAIRVGRDGQVGRIASVNGESFLPPPRVAEAGTDASRVIVSVTDNLKSSQTAKYYRVVARGFREDCLAYVDRRHQWNGLDDQGIPRFLAGGDYVMTFNDDKVQHDLGIAVTLAQPARLFLLVDDRAQPPKWLKESFVDTGWDVGIDEGYDDVPEVQTSVGPGKSIENAFSVWSQDVPTPSTVMLGSLQEEEIDSPPREVLRAMYGIVSTPLAGAGDLSTPD